MAPNRGKESNTNTTLEEAIPFRPRLDGGA
jgi:hypothetical protein